MARHPEGRRESSVTQLALIASDDLTVQEFLSEVLEMAGYRVLQASNGPEVLRLIDARTPSVILMNAHLPLLDGREVAREMAKRRINIPVILIEDNETNQGASPAHGVSERLTLPFTMQELLVALENAGAREPVPMVPPHSPHGAAQ